MNSSLPKTVQIMQPIIGHQHLTYTGICCITMGCYQTSTGTYNRSSFLHFDSLFITYLLWYSLGALRLLYCPNSSKYMERRAVTHKRPRICMSADYKHDQDSKSIAVTYPNLSDHEMCEKTIRSQLPQLLRVEHLAMTTLPYCLQFKTGPYSP